MIAIALGRAEFAAAAVLFLVGVARSEEHEEHEAQLRAKHAHRDHGAPEPTQQGGAA